jgi:DNA ligase (NAD+)
VQYFSIEENVMTIERLKSAGLQMESEVQESSHLPQILSGKTIVVSGVFAHFSRDGIKADVESRGGKVSGSISSKTTFVLAGADMGPSKLAKAKDLNIPVMSEVDYLEMIAEK